MKEIMINTTTVIVLLIVILVVILLLGISFWHANKASKKKRLWEEVEEAEEAIHKAFDLLRADVREQIETLDWDQTRKQLAIEEEKIIHQLKKDLDDAERWVRKEIQDIEKEVR